MKQVKLVAVLAVALTALFALGASAASAALPEFLPVGTKATFTSKSGKGTLETVGGKKITCEDDTNSGKITGAKTIEVTINFLGCKAEGFAANTKGDAEGHILVTCTGQLGYLSKASKDVGLGLKCGEIHIEVFGDLILILVRFKNLGIIGLVTPLNSSKTGPFVLSLKQTKGVQEFTKFEGEATSSFAESALNSGAFEQAGEETSDEITFSEAVSIDG